MRSYQRPASELSRPGWRFPREGKLWLLAAVLFWFVGWYKGVNLILLLAYLLVILVALNFWLARRSVRGIRAERRVPPAVHAGEPAPWRVILYARVPDRHGGWSVEDRISGIALGWFIAQWDGRDSLRVTQAVVFQRRGVYQCEPLRLWTRFPFGLIDRSIEVAGGDDVVVLPRCGRIDRRLLTDWLVSGTSGDGRRHAMNRATSHEADLHGLRPFRAGDSPRWIHWRTSARRGELMIREFELPDSPDLLVALDPWLAGDDQKSRDDLEAAVSLAATICREWCREPALRLGLAIFGPEGVEWIKGLTCSELALRMLEALARATGHSERSSRDIGVRLRRGWEGIPVLLVSTRRSSPVADSLEGRFGRPVAQAVATDRLRWYIRPS